MRILKSLLLIDGWKRSYVSSYKSKPQIQQEQADHIFTELLAVALTSGLGIWKLVYDFGLI